MRLINFGGQEVDANGHVAFSWQVNSGSPLIPTLSASLLLSFVLASLSRYRPNLLDHVETSKVNLLFDVYSSEADGFVIPAFRNLLYGQTMFMSSVLFT